jgi:CheY-like chemotaxis protein
MTGSGQTILLIEDNHGDVFIFERTVRAARIVCSVQVARTGQEAIDYLAGKSNYSDRAQYPFPFLIFIDLKLPLKGGFEVLDWIRSEPQAAGLPIAILTSSTQAQDISRARAYQALCYLEKPAPAEALIQTVECALGAPRKISGCMLSR